MNKPNQRPDQRRRKTIPITGTISKVAFQADHASLLALEYGQAWVLSHHDRKPPASGIVRRALQLYMHHLAELHADEELRFECMAMTAACKSGPTDEQDQQAAHERLQAAVVSGELPTYREVLRPGAVAAVAALEARVDQLVDGIARTPWGRLNHIKSTRQLQETNDPC